MAHHQARMVGTWSVTKDRPDLGPGRFDVIRRGYASRAKANAAAVVFDDPCLRTIWPKRTR